jgi:hypothetical protein
VGLFQEFAAAFQFPSYFVRGWDAVSGFIEDLHLDLLQSHCPLPLEVVEFTESSVHVAVDFRCAPQQSPYEPSRTSSSVEALKCTFVNTALVP